MTRGPVHEAFAAPLVHDPKPGPIVGKTPPKPVEEMPPDQRPEGDEVQWIPGYWQWDAGRNDFLWISGVWRDPPPGCQWVPGYWTSVDADLGAALSVLLRNVLVNRGHRGNRGLLERGISA